MLSRTEVRGKVRALFRTRKLNFLNEFHVSSASPLFVLEDVPVFIPNKSIMFPGQRL